MTKKDSSNNEKRVIIWGIGLAGEDIAKNGLPNCRILCFVDSFHPYDNWNGYRVILPDDIKQFQYDVIIVASSASKAIYRTIIRLGLDAERVIYLYRPFRNCDLNRDYRLCREILGDTYAERIKGRSHIISATETDDITPPILNTSRAMDLYEKDYVRIRTFEFVKEEIESHNISGDIAEFGVFRGEFAKYLNCAFKSRTLYLFDTFEGFQKEEAEREKQLGHCDSVMIEKFKDTTVEFVREILPYPEKVIFKKGYFPASLDGLETTFAFVSIDVDFEESIYNGLEYFYPRLVEYGYLFIHDYNSLKLKGVRNAVKRYEENHGILLKKVPLPDNAGTLVICK